MKFHKIILLSIVAIGFIVIFYPFRQAKSIVTNNLQNFENIKNSKNDSKHFVEKENQVFSWEDDEEDKFKIKLLEVGEGFHGDQVEAKSGEKWLALSEQDGKFVLKSTVIKVETVRDEIVDGENEKTGKSVSADLDGRIMFLLKNATDLKEGKIETVFFQFDNNEETSLKNGIIKWIEFNNENYELKVENKLSNDEFLTKGSELILSHNEKKQVLMSLPNGCDDCFWNVYWVGDLDQDGKLDFYFDLSNHYNVSSKQLFLSSKAKNGNLLEYVANFWTNGC